MNITKSEIMNVISDITRNESITPDMTFSDAGINSIKFIEIVLKIESITNQEFDENRLSPVFFDTINNFSIAVSEM